MVNSTDVTPASVWETVDGVKGRAPRRRITVLGVKPGKYHFDGGQGRPSPPDEVQIRLDDLGGSISSATMTAFLRTYVPVRS